MAIQGQNLWLFFVTPGLLHLRFAMTAIGLRFNPGTICTIKPIAVIVLALFCLTPRPLLAQQSEQAAPPLTPAILTAEDVYTIRDIAADATAETTATARDIALANARRAGFSRLMRRNLLQQDQTRLAALSDEQLADLVRNFEVADEKSSGRRYLARLTIRFDADKVRALLRQASIGFSETPGRAVLFLPVFDSLSGRLLWEDGNAWKAALASALEETGAAYDRLLPVILPLGDFRDMTAVSPQQAVAMDLPQLEILARRYGAPDYLLLHVTQYLGPAPGGVIAFDISLRRPGDSAATVKTERYEGGIGEPAAMVLRRAALSLVNRMQDDWVGETLQELTGPASMEVSAPLTSLAEWREIQGRLAKLPLIRQVELRSLSVNGAQMHLLFLGTPEKLSAALSQQGLVLSVETGQMRLSP